MGETRIDDIHQVTNEENAILAVPYYEDKEVKKAVFQMEHNKGLGSDGFPARTLSKRTC
jgi:hypothetical protein